MILTWKTCREYESDVDMTDCTVNTELSMNEVSEQDTHIQGMCSKNTLHVEADNNIGNKGTVEKGNIAYCMPEGRSIVDISFM